MMFGSLEVVIPLLPSLTPVGAVFLAALMEAIIVGKRMRKVFVFQNLEEGAEVHR